MLQAYLKHRDYAALRRSFLSTMTDVAWQKHAFPLFLIGVSRGDLEVAALVKSKITNGGELSFVKFLEKELSSASVYVRSRNVHLFKGATFPQRVQHAFHAKDWVLLFCECWLERKYKNGLLGAHAELCQSYLAYAMLKIGHKRGVIHHIENWKGEQGSLPHVALQSYILYFDRDFSGVLDKGAGHMPSPASSASDPFYSLLFEFYCDALLREGRKAELITLLEQEHQLNGETSWWLLFSGLMEFPLDKEAAAQKWESAGLSNSFCLNHSWGANSFKRIGAFKFDQAAFTPIVGSAQPKAGMPVVVACCDDGYLAQFLMNIYLNASGHKSVVWHYHIIVCKKIADIQHIIDVLLGLGNVSISIEKHYARPPRAYFTLPRFACARRFLSTATGPVLMTDVDVLVHDVEGGLEHFKGQGAVGLVFSSFYYHFPWHEVQIGLSYYDGSQQSKDFLDKMLAWIEAVYDPTHPYQWWIDQVAVAMALPDVLADAGVYKLSAEGRRSFKLAGSTPDAKRKYMQEILQQNPEVAALISSLSVA